MNTCLYGCWDHTLLQKEKWYWYFMPVQLIKAKSIYKFKAKLGINEAGSTDHFRLSLTEYYKELIITFLYKPLWFYVVFLKRTFDELYYLIKSLMRF